MNSPDTLDRLQVLLVDDDRIDRMTLEESVANQRLPYDLTTAASVQEAIERLGDAQFDLVLLDYRLSDGTGLDVLDHLGSTPSIFITGSGDESVAVDAMKRGAYDYLSKDPDRGYLTVLPVVVENVLARRRAEVALRASEERLRSILGTLPDLIFEADREGRLTFASPVAREILALSPADVCGRCLADLVVDADRGRLVDALEALAENGSEVRGLLCRVARADGDERIASVNARRYDDADGTAIGLRGSIRDVTELERAARALEESRALAARTSRELADARAQATRLSAHLGRSSDFQGLIGRHPKMRALYEKIELAASTDVAVHVHGASGSGKELVAHAVHNLSGRRDAPFVVVNCSAIPETLIESTLFGHAKGAFTGATADAVGYLGRAAGGTLFLDEIGDLSPLIQVKLLRFLQERTFERVGDPAPRTADVRIITATHHDLPALVRDGTMREDFYYRISVFPLEIPSLKQRRSDIPLLAAFFAERIGKRLGKTVTGISAAVMESFVEYDWPGNVRELENVLEYACVVAQDDTVEFADLPPHFGGIRRALDGDGATDSREQLREVLERHGWNRTRAAQALGISRVTLWKRLKACGLSEPGAESSPES